MEKFWQKVKKWKWWIAVSSVILITYYFSLPANLFQEPNSTVLSDRDGNLLSATIAQDGQWRFPQQQFVPEKFKEALILFEDKRFYDHPGVDLLATGRAALQNIRAGKIVSGGSTLTMQTIRLSRKVSGRTVVEKIIEMILATRLELRYSKDEIISLYAAHAPFGGNVVGIEASSWRYFGRDLDELSWAEAALLAVLPNNPSLIHLGKNREKLKEKRDQLLQRLFERNKFDDVTLALSKEENIPEDPIPLPRHARHLLDRAIKEGHAQQEINSTIDIALQRQAERIIEDHHQRLRGNQIFNAAAIILEVKTGNVLAYVGNTNAGREHGDQVDIIAAPRSTGSILKPFLYAALLDEGKLLQKTLVPDVPTIIDGFSPKNFSHDFDGSVPADKALIRSLNIPAVHELRDYRYEKFYDLLKSIGLTTLRQKPDHYGLSLILGGAEGTLWDITGSYASMARTLNGYFEHPGSSRYKLSDIHSPRYYAQSESDESLDESSVLSAASIWLTFDALKEVYRPGEETGWRYFSSSKKIAWKTGTSFGFRDGWAVGVNPDYAVGVWVGNGDGEGRPGLTGTETAAPVLFDLFAVLPGQSWFQIPISEMEEIPVCSRSGQRASPLCETIDTVWISRKGLESLPCSYHKKIHLSQDGKYRVNSECVAINEIKSVSWFVLPPIQEYYFRSKNLSYKPLPSFRKDCANLSSIATMDLLYPKSGSQIFVPRELDGTFGEAIFEAVHRQNNATVYWHMDGNFIGSTKRSHHMALSPANGNHVLTLVDENGEILTRQFKVLSTP